MCPIFVVEENYTVSQLVISPVAILVGSYIQFFIFFFRFMKHTSKPQNKSVTPVQSADANDNQTDAINTEGTPKPRGVVSVVSDDKLKDATPGEALPSSFIYII